MRGPRRRLLGGCAVVAVAVGTVGVAASANAGSPTYSVTLVLPASSLAAGQPVEATLVNNTSEQLELGRCPTLAERVDRRWVTVTHSNGRDVACPRPDPVGEDVNAHARRRITVELYDELAPGTYRVTLPYREARLGSPPLPADSLTASVTFRVTGPAP